MIVSISVTNMIWIIKIEYVLQTNYDKGQTSKHWFDIYILHHFCINTAASFKQAYFKVGWGPCLNIKLEGLKKYQFKIVKPYMKIYL